MQPGPLIYLVPASVGMGPGGTMPISVQVYFYFTFNLLGGNELRQIILPAAIFTFPFPSLSQTD